MPDPEVVADVPPQSIEPLRLDDEEEDDQRAEQDQAEIRDDVQHRGGREQDAAEGLHRVADQDREQRDEDRAEDGAEHGTQSPDDDHGQIVDGRADLVLLVVRHPEVVGVEDPGHAGVER